LLYADDTVILAESKEELQAALNSMYLYCKTWDLEINASKTEIVIFNKRKITEKSVFTLNNGLGRATTRSHSSQWSKKKLQLKHKNSLFTLQAFHYNYY
jgi:hypothetical protein